MKILHVSFSDLNGGAARASYRIHRCLIEQKNYLNIISQMKVVNKLSNDFTVYGNKKIFKKMNILKFNSLLNKLFLLNYKSKCNGIYSPSAFRTNFLNKINLSVSFNHIGLLSILFAFSFFHDGMINNVYTKILCLFGVILYLSSNEDSQLTNFLNKNKIIQLFGMISFSLYLFLSFKVFIFYI